MFFFADVFIVRHYFLPYFVQIYITTMPKPKLHRGKTIVRKKSIGLG